MTGLADEVRDGDALPGIHVRVCEQHGVELVERNGDRLFCPHRRGTFSNGHYVQSWKVVDRRRGQVVSRAEEEKSNRRPSAGIQDLKEKLMPKPVGAPATAGEKKTIARAKFKHDSGEVLWLRVIHAPNLLGGDAFRVSWNQLTEGKNKGGTISMRPDEKAARELYETSRKEATKLGWKEAPIGSNRQPNILPLPKPGTLAKPKGR